METPGSELCEECGAKRGNYFVCRPGAGPSRTLCKECYEASLSSPERAFVEAMRNARCRFCDGMAMTSDSMTSILEGHGSEPRFFCSSCANEYHQRILPRLREVEARLDGMSSEAQLESLRELLADMDLHMQRWVQQRDN